MTDNNNDNVIDENADDNYIAEQMRSIPVNVD